MASQDFTWLLDALYHVERNVTANQRIQCVSANVSFGCISIAVIRGDEEFPSKVIQYCPPQKDLSDAASLVRGALVNEKQPKL